MALLRRLGEAVQPASPMRRDCLADCSVELASGGGGRPRRNCRKLVPATVCSARFLKEAALEFLGPQAGAGNIWEGIERAARLDAADAGEAVELLDHHLAARGEGRDHLRRRRPAGRSSAAMPAYCAAH